MDILFALVGGVVGTLITQELSSWYMSVRRVNKEKQRNIELNAELGGFLKRINAVRGVREFEDQLMALEVGMLENRPRTLEELDGRVSAADLPDSLLDILVSTKNRASTESVPGNRPLSSGPWALNR